MADITWNERLALQHPRMDQTHREFVALLGALQHSAEADAPAEVLRCCDGLIAHTEAHFAQEERWMAALGFAPANCHAGNHANVLGVLAMVRGKLADEGDVGTVRLLLPELMAWFEQHAGSMDAALAMTMDEFGFDVETGRLARAPAAEAAPITGCGSTACG